MIDLSIAACRKRQSPRTHFVHNGDAICLFENFCFAFALFRQRTKEAFLEGKDLLERLFAFQTTEGNFPIYLHDYPRCFDRFLPLKIAPIFIHVFRDFPMQFERQEVLERVLLYAKNLGSLPPLWEMRRKALFGKAAFFEPQTANEWFEWIVSKQLLEKALVIEVPYSKELQAFLGEHMVQEGPEPQPVPIEWLFAEKEGFSPRLLRDHLHQIHAALLFPVEIKKCSKEHRKRFLWGGSQLHSLVFPNGTFFELLQEDLEMALYCNLSSETAVLINGKKATTFHLGDKVTLVSPKAHIELAFQLLEGKGDFVGHLSRANRPGQLWKDGVYDWKIELRTLRRTARCVLQIDWSCSFFNAELSTASPMACIPLST